MASEGAQTGRGIESRAGSTATGTGPRMAFGRRGMASQHKHGLPAFQIELLEKLERFLVVSQTPLLVTVHDIQRVLAPGSVDVVFSESGG